MQATEIQQAAKALYKSLVAQRAMSTGFAEADDAIYFAQSYLSDITTEIRLRMLIERAVIRRAVTDAIAAGRTVSVDDGEEITVKRSTDLAEIMGAIMSTDEGRLLIHADKGTAGIYLVHGNDGYDVIADYSTSLEPILAGSNALADALCDLMHEGA